MTRELGLTAQIIFGIVFLKRDLYKSSVNGTLVLYWFSTVGVGPPLALLILVEHIRGRFKKSC